MNLHRRNVANKPRKTRRPAPDLTRERIVAAALRILDREGVEGLTMRALGRELGVDPMAVYHHMPGKAAILDGIVDAVWSELRLPSRRSSWQKEARDFARTIRRMFHSHPNALPVLATRQNLSAAGFEAAERGIELFRRAGLSPARSLDMLNVCFSFLIGHALAEVGAVPFGPTEVAPSELVKALDEHGGSERFPNFVSGLRAKRDLTDMSRTWESGVTALIAGVEALARRSAG